MYQPHMVMACLTLLPGHGLAEDLASAEVSVEAEVAGEAGLAIGGKLKLNL
jgi:hypothetical protein